MDDVILLCVYRIIGSGGIHSSVVDQQHFIYSCLQYITSTTSLVSRVWLPVSSTLVTPS